MKALVLILGEALLVCGGCTSRPPAPVPRVEVEKPPAVNPVEVVSTHRRLSAKQENLLRTFALQEAPQLWQSVQSLRGEIVSRNKAMAQLAAELQEFDRKPEDDTTYRELLVGREQIACTLDNVYQKLENAYIAYKKFQATPGRKEYADAMNRALEDGIHEAEMMESRFKKMSMTK